MTGVLVVGVAVVDFVFAVDTFPVAAEKYQASDAVVVGGGCAANAAVAVSRLGGDAKLVSRIGDDMVGDLIVSQLDLEGVDIALVRRSPGGRSSFSSVCVDAEGERQIVNYRGAGLSSCPSWLPVGLEVGAVLADNRWTEGAAAALDLANRQGVPGIVDAEAPLDPAILAKASHVAFSVQGLRAMTGVSSPAEALAEVREHLPGWVCVTDGANGVYYVEGDDIVHEPAFEVDVKDTLAAGDVWHGAFALRLAEGADERSAITFANAVAAMKCTMVGGRSGCPSRDRVEDFLQTRPPTRRPA